jgi:hypothetical protein
MSRSGMIANLKVLAVVGVAAVMLTGCGGAIDESELAVNDDDATSSAISSPDPGAGANDGDDADDEADETDDDCKDGDRRDGDGHHKHHHHKFKVLDRLDGVKDKIITIASLPPGLPDRLLHKLQKLDTNSDGLVTRAEVKAHKKNKKHQKDRHKD